MRSIKVTPALVTRIEYLADHLSVIPLLAEWQHREWSHFRPNDTVADRAQRLHASARREGHPLTLVALADGELLGSASLVPCDMEIRQDLTPWLADVYVSPVHRRHGTGAALVRRVVQEAARLSAPSLYLFTTSKENERFYVNLGWSVRERVDYLGKLRVIMQIASRPPLQPGG